MECVTRRAVGFGRICRDTHLSSRLEIGVKLLGVPFRRVAVSDSSIPHTPRRCIHSMMFSDTHVF
jgi:hypothetical protein